MRLGLVSDVHANLQALDAVLGALEDEGVERRVCLGDVVGYGGDPEACLEIVAERMDVCLMGNHDLAVLEPGLRAEFNALARAAVEAHAAVLDERHLAILRTFAVTETVDVDGGVLLVHGTPGEREPFTYLLGPAQATAALARFPQRFAAVGHTHVPALFVLPAGAGRAREIGWRDTLSEPGAERAAEGRSARATAERTLPEGTRAILNPGSAGQPRDGDPRAAFAVLDTRSGAVRQARVPYDVAGAQDAIRRRGLPEPLAARLAAGR